MVQVSIKEFEHISINSFKELKELYSNKTVNNQEFEDIKNHKYVGELRKINDNKGTYIVHNDSTLFSTDKFSINFKEEEY